MPDSDNDIEDDLTDSFAPPTEEGGDLAPRWQHGESIGRPSLDVSANPWDLVGLTQNQLANQTPITAEVLRRVFEPNVLAQIRDAVRSIEQESTPHVNRWITFDITPPANEVELAVAVEELVLMGRSEIIQDRYQQLVRATWARDPSTLEGEDRSRDIRRERRRQQESLLELDAYLDEVIYEPENLNLDLTREADDVSSRLQSALGIDDDRLIRGPTLSTDIVYNDVGEYHPPESAWQNVRRWFIHSAPLPQEGPELRHALLELAWLRHTRRQAERYTLLVRSIHRLGGGDPSLPGSLRGNFDRLVRVIVEANQQDQDALVEVEAVSTGVVRGTALMISYDALDWHSPLSTARVRRWIVPNRYLPSDEVELVNAQDELDHLNHRRDQGLRYTQLCRELWAAREADSGMLESVIIRRLLSVLSSIEQLNPGVPAEDPYTRPEVEPIADVLLRRLRSGLQHFHAPPFSDIRPIADTPKVEEAEGTVLDAILDWGDDS